MSFKMSELFQPKPSNWGLRRDEVLWTILASGFETCELPKNKAELDTQIRKAFCKLTGHQIEETERFFVESLKSSGMFSGGIDPTFWRLTLLPLIMDRFEQLNNRHF